MRIEMITKIAQTRATAHVGVSFNDLSPAAVAAMPSNLDAALTEEQLNLLQNFMLKNSSVS
jgi:hypothetical protein